MEGTPVVVRPFVDRDFEADARISSLLHPTFPVSAQDLRQYDRAIDGPGVFKHRWAAELRGSGEVVGTAILFNPPWMYHPDRYWVSIEVHPEHQRRGIGLALLRAAEELAGRRHAITLWASAADSAPRNVAFFERAGFREVRRSWTSELDLGSVKPAGPDWPASRLEGVEFLSLAEAGAEDPAVRQSLYRLDCEAGRDVPSVGPHTDRTFDQFVELLFEGPGYFPEGILLARVDREIVGYTQILKMASDPGLGWVGFTGTRRAFRGRGIATTLKRRAIALAPSLGFRKLRTSNDSNNRPIWAINERLGFHPIETWIHGERNLPPVPGSGPRDLPGG